MRQTLKLIPYAFNLKEFSILAISAWNPLSTFSRSSIFEQLWITVLWSRLPTNFPIRLAGIFVYFCAIYMLTWRAITMSFLRERELTADIVTL